MKTIPSPKRTGNVTKKVTSAKSVPSKSGRSNGVKGNVGTMLRPRGLALLSRVTAKNKSGAPMVRRVTKLEKKYGPFNEV